MFVAVGTLVTSGLLFVTGWRPSLLATIALASVTSLAVAALGWRPLRQFQNADVEEDKSSDFIGRELITTHEVTRSGGTVHWSGAEWQARLAEDAGVARVGPGERMRIVDVENLALVLAPVTPHV